MPRDLPDAYDHLRVVHDAEGPPPDDAPPLEDFSAAPASVPHFRVLGHERQTFYFLPDRGGQVLAFAGRDLARDTVLMQLAPLQHWEADYQSKSGADWRAAANALIAACYRAGIYDPDRVRGRGAYLDDGRAVLHLGDRLLVDGQPGGLDLPGSHYVYEAGRSLRLPDAPALTTAQAHELVTICKGLRWERGIHGTLLAGFLAVAPVCGGLAWRPSIWITGGSGTGKTWLQDNVLRPALAGIAMLVQSKTSEAGIRQILVTDSLPVVFDEAEAEDQAAAARIQGVLDLVRQSSSEGGADIVKGSASGRAMRFRIRSCFALSSINAAILHEADANRITVLALRARTVVDAADDAAFRALNELVARTITADFAAGLVARSVRLLPLIRANAETFAQAVSIHLGSRRTGDQYGTLLAGAYSLHSERAISAADALAYVRKQDWQVVQDSETERDEVRLLSRLTAYRIRWTPGNAAPRETGIGRLVIAAWGGEQGIDAEMAEAELLEIGIRFAWHGKAAGVWVSNSHPAIGRILAGTPWAASWERALRRLDGAERSDSSMRFAPGHKARATWLPMTLIQGQDDPAPARAEGVHA